MKEWSRKFGIWIAGAALLAGCSVGGTVVAKTLARNSSSEAPILAPPATSAAKVGPFVSSYAPIIKGALPEVVSISTSRTVRVENPMKPFEDDPFFRHFFGDQESNSRRSPEQREQGLGSGVIIGTNGYILTNNHVVDDSTDVKVVLSDKREFKAHVVGRDPKTDIALVKIDADHLPAISLGDSSKVQVGDVVFAIGNPFGVGETATMGIVSALGRTNLGMEDYEDFIQTDAPINPGNSGGALMNAQGELIGINTAIISRSGGNQGIGFAIPVSLARHVMDQLVEHGHVVRGWLGATIQDVTPALAKGFGLEKAEGVLIADVAPDSPAAKAGLKSGDVVLSMNGKAVSSSAEMRMRVSESAPGTSLPMTVHRGSGTVELTAMLGELPSDRGEKSSAVSGSDTMRGLTVENLNAALREEMHLSPAVQGVVVSSADPGSAAADAGIQPGDVIESVSHHPVTNASEFEQAMQGASGKTAVLRVRRGGAGLFIAVEPR